MSQASDCCVEGVAAIVWLFTSQVSILFEVEDLSQASPATVSRAGMIYLNVEDLGWQPFITSWLTTKQNPVLVTALTKLIERYLVSPVFQVSNCNSCSHANT